MASNRNFSRAAGGLILRLEIAVRPLLLVAAAACSGTVTAQTIFTTTDFRADRELWTDPAYYRNNTVDELRGMALDTYVEGASGQLGSGRVYGSEGTGQAGARDMVSPYPFTSAAQHYAAWEEAAGGGTRHTAATLPDWRGRWGLSGRFFGGTFRGTPSPASDVAAILTPRYREYFVQELKATAEGRTWAPGAFCLPGGFARSITAVEELIVTPERVWTLGSDNGDVYIRRIYTDGSGHSDPDYEFPKWHGESVGFWDGDALVVHTNQIRGWHGGFVEFTDALETVERYRRVEDRIEGEITLYDPDVFVRPVTERFVLVLDTNTRPELRPLYNTCTDTNGPSNHVYLDERGFLNERLPGDPLYWDVNDTRPWGTFYNESDARYARYRATLPEGQRR